MNFSEIVSSLLCWERDEELDDHDDESEEEEVDDDEDGPAPDEDLPSVLCVTPMI